MFSLTKNYFLQAFANLSVTIYSVLLHYRRFGIYRIGYCPRADDEYDASAVQDRLKQIESTLPEQIDINSLTDKGDVLKNYEFYMTSKRGRAIMLSTSGTSGQGLQFPASKRFLRSQWCVFRKQFVECGVFGSWRLQFGGRDVKIFRRRFSVTFDFFDKKVIANQYSLDDKQTADLVAVLIKKDISWIHGYPSMILEFLQNWHRLYEYGSIQTLPKNIIITISSENCSAKLREQFSKYGVVKIFNMYGQTEGVANFFTCSHGKMHVHEDFSLVEFIFNGISYDIIGTSLKNDAFQFFRYKTGDTVDKVSLESCGCGRTSRVVEGLNGRSDDYLITKVGLKVGRLDHLTKGNMHIIRAQIIQKEYGKAVFTVQCDPSYSQNILKDLQRRCNEYFGDQVDFDFIFSSNFTLKPNGKFTFVLNEID